MTNQQNVKQIIHKPLKFIPKIGVEPDKSRHPLIEINRLLLTRIEESEQVKFLGNRPVNGQISGSLLFLETFLVFKSLSSAERFAVKMSIEILDDVELACAGYDPKLLFEPEVNNDN